jgi:hypothetical protein
MGIMTAMGIGAGIGILYALTKSSNTQTSQTQTTESSQATWQDGRFADLLEVSAGFRFFKVTPSGAELSFGLKCEDEDDQTALGEVKLFKKVVQTKKKQIREHIQTVRLNHRVKMANQGPASLGLGATLFKGTSAGAAFRTLGTAKRSSQRADLANELKPYENLIQVYDQMIIVCDRIENQVKAGIIARQ